MPANRISTLGALQSVPIPTDTTTYKHVSHAELDKLTRDGLSKTGFQLNNTSYLTARDGQIAIAKYFIDYGNDPDMKYMLVWQNSYNKQLSLKYIGGAVINICSNGLIYGDIDSYFRKKHQSDIQVITPEIINEYITKGAEQFDELIQFKERLKQVEVTKRTCAELVGRMYIEEGIITANQLSIIKQEIIKPSFDYGTTNTAWNLMNDITFSLKQAHPSNYMKQHLQTSEFLKKELIVS